MNVARVWCNTALGFLAFLTVMAVFGFATGNAIGPYGYTGLLVFEAATLVVLMAVTISKPTWLHLMIEESKLEDQRNQKERSLALIGQVKFYQNYDSNKVFFHIGIITLLLVLSKRLDPVLFWIFFWIQSKSLIQTLRRSTKLMRRIIGILVAPTIWLVLFWLSYSRLVQLDWRTLALLCGFAIPIVADEAYVLWQDLKRAKTLKTRIDLLSVLQSRINQLYMQ